jgi:signal transduction histidine kinase
MSNSVLAGESATKDECVSMCKKAAKAVTDKGMDTVIKLANDPKGPYVWKDSYIYIIDLNTKKVVAHPEKPALIGKDMSGIKDIKGKMFFVEIINLANEKGEGWVDYMWPKPGGQTPVAKSSYVLKVSGKPYALVAGYYH